MRLRRAVGVGPLRRARAGALLLAAAATAGLAACGGSASPAAGQQSAMAQAAGNQNLDTGTALNGVRAPDFRLANQFGQPVSLGAFRGKVVILAFTDSECTTICPLTTTSMLEAKALLGRAGEQVQLLGIDANPQAASQADMLAYSRSHGMVNRWDFLTGSSAQLDAVWKAYHVYVQVTHGQIDHTPALYVIDTRGREQKLYLTTMAYTTVSQAAELLAREASGLLPGHPPLTSQQSLAFIGGTPPGTATTIPAAAGGAPIPLGPGKPRLLVFFATWLDETTPLASSLTGLNAYAAAAAGDRLPGLVAVDEAVTEPSPGSAAAYIQHLGTPLRYPVGLDTAGRLADGYGVQDQPWLVLVSAAGKVVWSHDGWLPVPALEAAVRTAG
jgi:cytochrome oxidase Cu insertion factor (SCO1/SenC/PrrC family)